MTLLFDGQMTQDLEEAARREWLETNGLGGWASSTISGAHTRRYHGLLVAAMRPPTGRMATHFSDAGVGTISEIFDAAAPHLARGCIAQAWSVSEILRAYVEDVLRDR